MNVAGWRILSVAFASLLLLFGCGDTASTQEEAPKQIRFCGELDGVEPVEPTVTGEDEYGCPIIQPVPCTRPATEHRWACGPDCRPATAFSSDSDEWVIGCVLRSLLPDGCSDPEPDPPPLCITDPFVGNDWWLSIDCRAANGFFALDSCWAPCDAYTEEALAPFCP